MTLNYAAVIIFLFVSISLFYRADCSLAVKIGGSLLVLFISLKFVIYQAIGGAFFSPQLPYWFILVMEALYGSLILLFFLLLLWDLYLGGNWLLARIGFPAPRHLPAGWIKAGLVLISLGAGIWGTWEAVRVPQPIVVNVTIKNLPTELEGVSIVQLSDLHIGPLLKKGWLEQVVEITNSLKPDIIALTGDYVDGYVTQLADELAPLGNLQAKYGIFGVTGNHEYYWNVTEWEDALKNLGVTMLNNEHKTVEINSGQIVIAGIPDLAANRFGFDSPNLEKALRDAPQVPRILLSHQPRNAPDYLQAADLQLSGHTHGGVMFFLKPLLARYNNGFVQGLYERKDGALYVSSGTGLWNGFSSRIAVPSEITKLILAREK